MEPVETLALGLPVSDNGLAKSMSSRMKDPSPASPEALELSRLIDRAVAGDRTALEAIYRRFQTPLFNLAYRYTRDAAAAEDILQEVFIKVFTHLDEIKSAETFPAWVYRIGVNASLTYLRRRTRERRKSVPMADIEGRIEEASYDSDTAHLRRPIEEAMEALSPKLRSVFILHDVQGFKHEEIAASLEISVGTSKSHLFKARRKIRRHLKSRAIEGS